MEEELKIAYQAHITNLYTALSEEILCAEGNEEKIKEAEKKFRNGLSHAANIRKRAMRITGLQ